MDNNTTTNDNNTPLLALVTNIADARKTKADQAAQDEAAELEVSGPQAIKLQGDEWMINACDGEQVYVWIARKKTPRSEGYTITEVYPGFTKTCTALRDVDEPADLEMEHTSPLTTLSDVLEDLEEVLFDDEDDDGEGVN